MESVSLPASLRLTLGSMKAMGCSPRTTLSLWDLMMMIDDGNDDGNDDDGDEDDDDCDVYNVFSIL